MTFRLLTVDDIAAIYQVNRRYARDFTVKLPGFPDPAPGSTEKKPRWLESDVRSFICREPARMPQDEDKCLI